MHRDLKPENFLFANKKESSPLKAIDFGLSVFFRPGKGLYPYSCMSQSIYVFLFLIWMEIHKLACFVTFILRMILYLPEE